MIQAVIFSKDRACQLDLLIRSIRKFWIGYNDCNITVIYKYSNDDFKKGYELLKAKHSEFKFREETAILKDIQMSFDTVTPYSMFLVDDDIFVRVFNIHDKDIVWHTFTVHNGFVCLSLRLGANIHRNYEKGAIKQPMDFLNDFPYVWKWRQSESDFGYPGSVDGHIFRTPLLLSMLDSVDHCCNIEPTLMRHMPQNEYMICYNKSVIVNIPNNMVQKLHKNQHMNGNINDLNNKILEGKTIKLDPFINIDNDSCHYPMEYCFD
jgi:hypothetical protein